jgi:hypothetical protein
MALVGHVDGHKLPTRLGSIARFNIYLRISTAINKEMYIVVPPHIEALCLSAGETAGGIYGFDLLKKKISTFGDGYFLKISSTGQRAGSHPPPDAALTKLQS